MITKMGYVFVFDIETGLLIYTVRISNETVFVTAEHRVTGGVLGINRSGQVSKIKYKNRVGQFLITGEWPGIN